MREIKFRAWDKVTKQLVEIDSIGWVNDALYIEVSLPDPRGNEQTYRVSRATTNCEIMQYTGLKDKNGKEIYEGDIRVGKYYFQEEAKRGVEVMTWHEKEGYWYWKNVSPSYIPDFIEVEVIGNIYENPELVQSK